MLNCTRRSIASATCCRIWGSAWRNASRLLLPDSPEWVYVFFGAIKVGAVAIPLNTLLASKDYEYLLNDSRARVLVAHASMMDRIASVRDRLRYLKQIILVDGKADRDLGFDALMERSSAMLDPVDTSKDDMAFWLYSSGTTGFPKGAIHLHHDMIVAADRYATETIGLTESDVSFSVAKLFFAYGLGNGLYFPLRTGGTTVLLPERPLPEKVFETIDCHRPTVFYGVPTSYAACCKRPRRPAARACTTCGCAFLRARPCPGISSSAGANGSALRSSTASARQRSCTSSSPIDREGPERAARGRSSPAFRRGSSMTTALTCPRERSVRC